jgi:opacity protein-like surface antigen
MLKTSSTTKRLLFSLLVASLALAGTAFAQDSSTTQSTTTVDLPPPGTSTFELPRAQDYEVGIFAGASFWKRHDDTLQTGLADSGLLGIYLDENFAKYVGTEQSLTYSQNALQFQQSFGGTLQNFKIAQRLWQFQESLLVYFKPKRSMVRPYVKAGLGMISYRPTDEAVAILINPTNAGLGATGIQSDTRFAATYGAGLKVRFSDHFGLRAEVLGVISREPHYGLAQSGTTPSEASASVPNSGVGATVASTGPLLFIPQGGLFNGVEVSGGMYFVWGGKETISLPVSKAWDGVSIAASGNNVCAGTPITMTASISNPKSFAVPNYRWSVDGHDAGSSSNTLTVQTDGSHQVGLTVVDSQTLSKSVVPPVSIMIRPHTNPTVTGRAAKSDLDYKETTQLYATPQAGDCAGSLSVSWSVTEGTVSGADTATYDSSSAQCGPDGGTRPVTATVTVVDSKGGSATATVPLTIKCPNVLVPVPQDDIIFPTGNSRVNNCGKRVLIDQVYPALTSGQYANYDVVLVGHEGNEKVVPMRGKRGRKAAEAASTLAMDRALHAAQILASASGICPKPGIDPSRIKIATLGPGQGPDLRKPACAASILERKGSKITSSDDQLKDQRVEIWFVPKGANLPASAANAQQAPATVTADCPK